MVQSIKKFLLEIVVFVSGASVMILEITGSRVLAPYLGTSIFVWTSLIGIVLGSLSLGYWWGGKLADKKPSYKIFSLIIFVAASMIGMIAFVKLFVLVFLQLGVPDIPTRAVISTLILFAPSNVVLGMVSPYAVKLKIKSIKKVGTIVGNLYAVSTIGSIAGTFLAGFLLISYLGNTKILLFLSIVLIATSIVIYLKEVSRLKIAIIIFLVISFYGTKVIDNYYQQQGFIDVDTKYNRVWIYKTIDKKTGKAIKALSIDPFSTQSAMFLDSDDLVFDYTKFYRLVRHFKENLNKSLVIGGAAYSYPKDFLNEFPAAKLDVVEIDSGLTELAKKYFNLGNNPRLTIYHEDGRTFINSTQNKYDAVFIDAFTSALSVPYQLTTKETASGIYDLLAGDGLVMVNLISSIEGKKGKFLRAEYATYKEVFPQVYLFPVENSKDGNLVQNIIIIALKSQTPVCLKSKDYELSNYLEHLWTKEVPSDIPILTDDYAPVDWYTKDLI